MRTPPRKVTMLVLVGMLGLILAACDTAANSTTTARQNGLPETATAAATSSDAQPAATAVGANTDSSEAGASTATTNDPVAQRIAEEFSVPVSEVEQYHEQGVGYGVLAQFYAIANGRCGGQATSTVDQLVQMQQQGMGMGDIRKQALGDASARACNLGQLKQTDLDQADTNNPTGPKKDK